MVAEANLKLNQLVRPCNALHGLDRTHSNNNLVQDLGRNYRFMGAGFMHTILAARGIRLKPYRRPGSGGPIKPVYRVRFTVYRFLRGGRRERKSGSLRAAIIP